MAKVYTDLEQSKRLAEFLPIESADGYWFKGFPAQPYMVYTAGTPNPGEHIPCWSLAKLFEIIPVIIECANNICRLRMDKSQDDFNIWYEDIDSGLVQSDLDIITPNMVDTCVEMIEKLHNEKLTLWQK